jgi:hypothetical protein
MQIMFVVAIIILNGIIVSNLTQQLELKTNNIELHRQMYNKVELSDTISSIVKIAYDLGQQTAGCPGLSREIHGLTSNFKLCWIGLDNNNCFEAKDNRGFLLCISNSQNVSQNKKSLIEYLIPTAMAQYNESGELSYEDIRDYNVGNNLNKTTTSPLNFLGLPNNTAGARVIIPPAQVGANINDFVNCQRAHTECFNISFCINGTNTCTSKNKITQTFAIRHY